MSEFNVLSLFDGISCGQQALHNCGIPYTKYYASEIDQRAIAVTQRRWPKTIQFGSVTKIKAEHFMSPIHLLMGGSPCQGFSFAGKQLNFDDPRSKLFFEFVRLKKELKPTYFFLENVRMVKESEKVITEILGVEPIRVNSGLVSAQERKRLYWTNIPGFSMPKDRDIKLRDILEFGEEGFYSVNKKFKPTEKANTIDANYFKGLGCNQTRTGIKVAGVTKSGFEHRSRVYDKDGKCPTITAVCGGDQEVKIAKGAAIRGRYENGAIVQKYESNGLEKANSITTVEKDSYVEFEDSYRKLTPVEVERCFGLPDNYTKGISLTGRYHALGNGWQVDTIMEFFKHLPKL